MENGPEAFASALDVRVGDYICLQRREQEADDLWDEVVAVTKLPDWRVGLRTRVVGSSVFLANDRVTVRRPVPEDELIIAIAYAVQFWWKRQDSDAGNSLGGSDDKPDADDWQLATFISGYIRELFTVEIQPVPAVPEDDGQADSELYPVDFRTEESQVESRVVGEEVG